MDGKCTVEKIQDYPMMITYVDSEDIGDNLVSLTLLTSYHHHGGSFGRARPHVKKIFIETLITSTHVEFYFIEFNIYR